MPKIVVKWFPGDGCYVYCMFLWQQVICKVAKGTRDDVDAAVEAAHVSLSTQRLFTCLLNISVTLKCALWCCVYQCCDIGWFSKAWEEFWLLFLWHICVEKKHVWISSLIFLSILLLKWREKIIPKIPWQFSFLFSLQPLLHSFIYSFNFNKITDKTL